MATDPSSSNNWLSLIEGDAFFEEIPSSSPFVWNKEQMLESSNDNNLKLNEENAVSESLDTSLKYKRKEAATKDDSCSKAVREKMRRERLNVRFLELSETIDPEKTPKTDKSLILSDALRVIEQLRSETNFLKEENSQLQEQLSYLKVEKNELKEEKTRLASETEILEYQRKNLSNPFSSFPYYAYHSPYQTQAPQMHAQMHTQMHTQMNNQMHAQMNNQMHLNHLKPNTVMPMLPSQSWPWLPPSVLDTSQDHVLHPPSA